MDPPGSPAAEASPSPPNILGSTLARGEPSGGHSFPRSSGKCLSDTGSGRRLTFSVNVRAPRPPAGRVHLTSLLQSTASPPAPCWTSVDSSKHYSQSQPTHSNGAPLGRPMGSRSYPRSTAAHRPLHSETDPGGSGLYWTSYQLHGLVLCSDDSRPFSS